MIKPNQYSMSRRARRRSRGQSLVEFAVVLPVFLLILFGIMDFGFLLYSRMTVINAAREGARIGITYTETPNMIPSMAVSQVTGSSGGLLTSGMVTVTCVDGTPSTPNCSGFPTSTPPSVNPGDSVRVNVTYPYRPFFPLLVGQTINVSSVVQMTLE